MYFGMQIAAPRAMLSTTHMSTASRQNLTTQLLLATFLSEYSNIINLHDVFKP